MESTNALIERLIEKHLETLRTLTAGIRSLAAEMRGGEPGGRQAAKTALGLAHQIAGSAGSIGFGDVSVSARVLEEALRGIVGDDAPIDPEQSAVVRALVERLDLVVSAQRPDTSSLFGRDFSPHPNFRLSG